MMKNSLRFFALTFGVLAISSAPLTAAKQSYTEKLAGRLTTAEWVLETIMVDAKSTIPRNLLRQTSCECYVPCRIAACAKRVAYDHLVHLICCDASLCESGPQNGGCKMVYL